MTNLLLTVSILVTTNWTEVTTPGNNKEWPQVLEVGRLQTNYVVSTAHPIHPALRAEPDYGPWEFARPVLVPFNFNTSNQWVVPISWTNPPASEVPPPRPQNDRQ